jgi:hypothetical protein
LFHRNCKPTYLQSKTGLKNGEWKLTDASRSTSNSQHEKKRAPCSNKQLATPQKEKEDYTLTGDSPGTNTFS